MSTSLSKSLSPVASNGTHAHNAVKSCTPSNVASLASLNMFARPNVEKSTSSYTAAVRFETGSATSAMTSLLLTPPAPVTAPHPGAVSPTSPCTSPVLRSAIGSGFVAS